MDASTPPPKKAQAADEPMQQYIQSLQLEKLELKHIDIRDFDAADPTEHYSLIAAIALLSVVILLFVQSNFYYWYGTTSQIITIPLVSIDVVLFWKLAQSDFGKKYFFFSETFDRSRGIKDRPAPKATVSHPWLTEKQQRKNTKQSSQYPLATYSFALAFVVLAALDAFFVHTDSKSTFWGGLLGFFGGICAAVFLVNRFDAAEKSVRNRRASRSKRNKT